MVAIKSKVTKALINYYLLNKGAELYVNESARLLELDPKNTHRKLVELEEQGVLLSRFSGQQKYYRLNINYPLLKELRAIVDSTIGLPAMICENIKSIFGIKEAYIFGSFAKNELDEHSDIDILVIGTHRPFEVSKKMAALSKKLKREFNAINMSSKEYERKKYLKDPFLQNIFASKIIKVL